MDDIRRRLDQNLTAALSRLRQLGGAVAVEVPPGGIGDNSRFANETDEIQASENREISFATREMLVERVEASLGRSRPAERRGVRRVRGVCRADCPGAAARRARGADMHPVSGQNRAVRAIDVSRRPS